MSSGATYAQMFAREGWSLVLVLLLACLPVALLLRRGLLRAAPASARALQTALTVLAAGGAILALLHGRRVGNAPEPFLLGAALLAFALASVLVLLATRRGSPA